MNFKLLNTVSYVIETTPGLVSMTVHTLVYSYVCRYNILYEQAVPGGVKVLVIEFSLPLLQKE